MAKQGSVGPSRSGDQFHYQWAARQCLGLLTGENGLVAVAIEGASLDEGDASTSVGDEVIDVGLYYGSEDVTAAKSIRYVQLKHSSRRSHEPWTASGLKGTIESFNGRLRDECLNEHWFTSLLHARTVIETWRREYNEERPKNALGGLTPEAYAKTLAGSDTLTPDSKADRY